MFSLKFPPGAMTASEAYDRYMRCGSYLAALKIADEHGLSDEDKRDAACKAADQLQRIHEYALAHEIRTKYGLNHAEMTAAEAEAETVAFLHELIRAHAALPRLSHDQGYRPGAA
jgi:hypothetical protein